MSLKATAWAWEQTLPPPLQVVLLALADHHNGETGQCNPSIERLRVVTSISRRQIITHLRSLEELGLITKHRHQVGFRRSSNHYALHLGKVRAVAPGEGAASRTQTGSRTGTAEPEGEELRSSPRKRAAGDE